MDYDLAKRPPVHITRHVIAMHVVPLTLVHTVGRQEE